MSSTGTVKKVTLAGVTFDVMSDANFDQKKGRFENEEIVTSGKIVQKKTARAQMVESVNLQCSEDEAEVLRALSERTSAFPMSYTTAAARTFRATGFINFESHDTETGLAVVKLVPEDADGFVLF